MQLRIVPLSQIPDDMLDAITNSLRNRLRIISDVLPQTEIPKELYNAIRHQYMAEPILDFLAKNFRGRVFGITTEDIYTGDLTFIFGQANALHDVALLSLHRLNPSFYKESDDNKLFIGRAVKEAVHEVGHMFGLRHCRTPKCVMNFSNTVWDVDRKSKNLCNSCKLQLGV